MKRQNVYKLIDGEREYQDSKPPRPEGDATTSVSSWLLYMEKQLQDAKTAIYNLDELKALEHVRKVTALGVACMEYNETPARES